MEQRHARSQLLGARASTCALTVALTLSLSGCWTGHRQAAVPAAQRAGEERPMQLLPEMEYVSQRDSIVRIVKAAMVIGGRLQQSTEARSAAAKVPFRIRSKN